MYFLINTSYKEEMKKIIILVLVISMFLSTLSAVQADGISLNDIANHWAKSNIDTLISKGIVNGYPDGTFRPDFTLKFEEFIKMIVVAFANEEISAPSGSEWYTSYTNIAIENKYINDKDIELVGKDINRMTMATVIYNILNEKDGFAILQNEELQYLSNQFSDLSINDSKTLYIAHAGIINGYPNGTFQPSGYLTRAEATTVILRLIDNSLRTPIKIVLPTTLADFPEPDLEYLYNYTTLRGVTARENYKNIMSTGEVHPCKQVVDTATNFIELLTNRDYRTINQKSITNVFYNDTLGEVTKKTLSYKDWLLYYTNASQEYCNKNYYSLRSQFLIDNPSYTQEQVDKEIDRWFEFYQDKYVNDTINNQVIVQGKFYTADDLYIWADGVYAARGILRFKYDNHNNPANIKEELNLVLRNIVVESRNLIEHDVPINAWNIYIDYSNIGEFKVGQWYEIAMDIVINQDGSSCAIRCINDVIGGKSDYGFYYIYPIYIKELN